MSSKFQIPSAQGSSNIEGTFVFEEELNSGSIRIVVELVVKIGVSGGPVVVVVTGESFTCVEKKLLNKSRAELTFFNSPSIILLLVFSNPLISPNLSFTSLFCLVAFLDFGHGLFEVLNTEFC